MPRQLHNDLDILHAVGLLYAVGNVQLAYEYAYGFDGGRRWRKDYLNGVWTRYPCGAGELVEQQKPLEGGSWTTSALYLQGLSLVRRNNEWHHFDPQGTAQVITNNSAGVVSNNVRQRTVLHGG